MTENEEFAADDLQQEAAIRASQHVGFETFKAYAVEAGIGDAGLGGQLGHPDDWLLSWETFLSGWEAALGYMNAAADPPKDW